MTNKLIAPLLISSVVLAAGCVAAEPSTTDEATVNTSSQDALTGQITPHTFPPLCGPVLVPCLGSASLASSAHASLTYSSSCVSQCELSWVEPSTGQGGSEAWPAGAAGTTGAVPGLVYTLTCGLITGGCTAFLVSGTTTVL